MGGTRRVVVNGFGGEGKTYLAQEAGRWLQRACMFKRVCFVSYAAFQGSDPVGLAVSTLGITLGRNLLDAKAVTEALKQTSTLLILDNLETLGEEPLKELLAAAVGWSEAGASRVLITTRSDDLLHSGFPTKESNLCRYLLLQGLAEQDALDWFEALMTLPPEPQVPLPQRDALRNLFANVGFHPLSVRMLSRQLKFRRIAELGERLEVLLTETSSPLLASLNLSLERLDPQSASHLPRLGVFQGGAFEDDLIAICELDDAQWQPLRRGLEQTGLIQIESVPGVTPPFLHFHPTLAPALWTKLNAEERVRITNRYQEWYFQLSCFLATEDSKQQIVAVRAIARRELPNLLAAVYGALDAGMPWAVDFAYKVSRFLDFFGLGRDRAALTKRAQRGAGERGSDSWCLALSNLGDQLSGAGKFQEAESVFADILAHLGNAPSFRRCATLVALGRCYESRGQVSRAEAAHRRALAEGKQLEPTTSVRQLMSTAHADLGDIFRAGGRYREARAAYEESLTIKQQIGDDRGIAVALGQLGTLALVENDLEEARSRYGRALETFQGLGEPSSEAIVWHQLGRVHQQANRLPDAEEAYRRSASIRENIGDLVRCAGTWDQIAQVMDLADRPDDAEAWFGKALEARRSVGDLVGEAKTLNNLSVLLSSRVGRIRDARTYAEQALVIKKALDPAVSEIWKTYQILAEVAGEEGNLEAARSYHREARASYAAATINQEKLRRWGNLIKGLAAAAADPSSRPPSEQALSELVEHRWTKLVEALRRILDGERDEDAVCEPLDFENSVIVAAVLRGIADPETLREIPSAEPADSDAELAGMRRRLEKHLPLIGAVVGAINQPELRSQLDLGLQQMEQHGWNNLVASIRRILDGERSADALVEGLDEEDTLIISVILSGIENPEALRQLLDGSPLEKPES